MNDFLDLAGEVIDTWLIIFFGSLIAVGIIAFILTFLFKTKRSLLILTGLGILFGFLFGIYETMYLGILMSLTFAGIFLMALLIRHLKTRFNKA
jgi:hypothetical protein